MNCVAGDIQSFSDPYLLGVKSLGLILVKPVLRNNSARGIGPRQGLDEDVWDFNRALAILLVGAAV